MTRTQQTLAAWCGGAAVVLLVAFIVMSSRDGTLDDRRSEADTLHTSYVRLYPEAGIPSGEATSKAERLRDHQVQAKNEVERILISTIPDEYRRTAGYEAPERLGNVRTALKNRAERQKISLPPQFPFEAGFSTEEGQTALQLAQVWVLKQALELCMDSGITRITLVKEGKCHMDPSGSYAVITCDFSVEGTYEAFVSLVDQFRTHHTSGLGLRDLRLTQGPQSIQASFTVSLLTVNDPAWKLQPLDGGGAITRPAGGTTTEPATRRSRLSGG